MQKVLIMTAIIAMVIFTVVLWLFKQSGQGFSEPLEYLHFGIIALVMVFALFILIKRWNSVKRGQPAEDEMSKRIMQRTAALSYYISLYLWVFILFIKDRVDWDTEQLIGTGILGMAIVYAVIAVFFNIKGVSGD